MEMAAPFIQTKWSRNEGCCHEVINLQWESPLTPSRRTGWTYRSLIHSWWWGEEPQQNYRVTFSGSISALSRTKALNIRTSSTLLLPVWVQLPLLLFLLLFSGSVRRGISLLLPGRRLTVSHLSTLRKGFKCSSSRSQMLHLPAERKKHPAAVFQLILLLISCESERALLRVREVEGCWWMETYWGALQTLELSETASPSLHTHREGAPLRVRSWNCVKGSSWSVEAAVLCRAGSRGRHEVAAPTILNTSYHPCF